MQLFTGLDPEEQALAVETQFQFFVNLAVMDQVGILAASAGPDLREEERRAISETVRLAKQELRPVEAAVLAAHRDVIGRIAQLRAERAYYADEGDIVVGRPALQLQALPTRQPGSSGRAKIRTLEAHEGGARADQFAPQDKVSGVFIDDRLLVARIRCFSRDPEKWVAEDLEGRRISPASTMKPSGVKRQKAAVRSWALDHFNGRAAAGDFDDQLGE